MGTNQVTGGLRKPGDRNRRDQKPRVLHSCTPCRQRKQRCDRKLPCNNCAQRNEESFCRYATNPPMRSADRAPTLPSRIHYLEDRIKQLETCIEGKASPATRFGNVTPEKDMRMQGTEVTHRDGPTDGLLLSGSSGTRYINSAHWQTIMNATRALKEGSSHTEDSGSNTDEPVRTPRGPFLLVGLSGEMSIGDLLAALPHRQVVESLVSTFMNSKAPSLNLIHRPTFQNELNDLWKDPTKVSPAWLACLYGVMSCAVWIDHITKRGTSLPSAEVPETFDFYRKTCALCLTSSNYTTPGRYKVEALGIYLGLEYLSSNNLKTSVLVLLGICIRLAIMMGYHRDSRSYSNISVFEAEMRRRTWLYLQITDSTVSCQTGVPRVISRRLSDTALPRDLSDTSFGPTTVELPPPQSDTQRPTNITYLIAVWRILAVYNDMVDILSFNTFSYDETLQLNHDLEVARDHIPPLLRMQATDLGCPPTDDDIIVDRHSLEITFQRTRCILHRQYLLANRTESKNENFRGLCVNAAQRIIELQIKMFQDIIPRAQKHQKAWFGASRSITDCLTAAMIICFEIINLSQAEQTSHADRISGLIELLRNLYNTWKIAPDPSFEASQSSETLATMFKLVQSGDSLRSSGPKETIENDRQAPPGPCLEPSGEVLGTQDPLTVGCLQDMLNSDWEFEMFDWCLWDREMQELNGIISNNMAS